MEDLQQQIEDLKSELSEREDEITELEDELKEANKRIDELENELTDKDTELEEAAEKGNKYDDLPFDPDDLQSINLGLDTIHYCLESGNLKVSQQLESAFNLIKS